MKLPNHAMLPIAALLTVMESGCWPSEPGDPLRDFGRLQLDVPKTHLVVGDSVFVEVRAFRRSGSEYQRRLAYPVVEAVGAVQGAVRFSSTTWVRAVQPGVGYIVGVLRDRRDSVAVTVVAPPLPQSSRLAR